MSDHTSSLKAIIFALLANFGIALTKSVAAAISGSGSMLAESIHSFADCANQLLLLLGLSRAGKAPDERHPLGYGKAIFFWSFIVALLLFSLGGVFSLYEGIHKLSSQEPLHNTWIALIVLGLSIILESLSLAGAVREINKLRGGVAFFRWFAHTRKAELVVVVGEDTAAIAGLVSAFGFLLAATITGNPVLDAIGSMVIGCILISVALFVGIRVQSFLIGERAEDALETALRQQILASEGMTAIHELITVQLGADVMLAVKVGMQGGLDIAQAIDLINRMEWAIKQAHPEVRFTFVEPDIS